MEQLANSNKLVIMSRFRYFWPWCSSATGSRRLVDQVSNQRFLFGVGGGFPQAARRALRYGDGWCPFGRTGSSLLDVLGQYRQMARDAGRDPETLPVTSSIRPRMRANSPAIAT